MPVVSTAPTPGRSNKMTVTPVPPVKSELWPTRTPSSEVRVLFSGFDIPDHTIELGEDLLDHGRFHDIGAHLGRSRLLLCLSGSLQHLHPDLEVLVEKRLCLFPDVGQSPPELFGPN